MKLEKLMAFTFVGTIAFASVACGNSDSKDKAKTEAPDAATTAPTGATNSVAESDAGSGEASPDIAPSPNGNP